MLLSIVLNKCVAQTVPTDKEVLNYLFKESAKAYYLQKDTANLSKEIAFKDQQLVHKDSLISNRNKALTLCENQSELIQSQLLLSEKQKKALTKKVNLFKFTSISIAIIGTITTFLALFR